MSRGRWLKRPLDVALAGAGLLVLSPVLAAAALAVRLGLGPPVLFRQARVGRGGRLFEFLKLRTLSDARDAAGELLPDAERFAAMTRTGRLLRASSLDELPQLLNVLRGDMSLVGPRPMPSEYLPRFSPAQARRHEVRPGITGLAQVSGRAALDWDERFRLDVWYVDHWSLGLDLKLLALTVLRVLRREGVQGTVGDFRGEAAAPPPASSMERAAAATVG